MKRLAIAGMLSIATGLLTCGCMWGHVYDANTGLEVEGATVSWVDGQGNSNSMTTGLAFSEGFYVFDCNIGKVPMYAPVTFHVTAPGYSPLVVQRQVIYDDNPNESYNDCSNFWSIQDFSLVPLSKAPGAPSHTPVPTPTVAPTVVHPPTPTPTRKPGIMVR